MPHTEAAGGSLAAIDPNRGHFGLGELEFEFCAVLVGAVDLLEGGVHVRVLMVVRWDFQQSVLAAHKSQ